MSTAGRGTDFGIANVRRQAGANDPARTVGTPPYMRPEQARTKEWAPTRPLINRRRAYEMLLGRLPFAQESVMRFM